MGLACAVLVLIRVLRTFIGSIANNLVHKYEKYDILIPLGVVAHLARAFEWHSKGRAFESPQLQFFAGEFVFFIRFRE